jgi:hypothetical protein
MSQQTQTYTPAQYLEAGYRAEMAGDHARAAQYYHYLAEVFPDSPEGESAHAGLVRLSSQTARQPQPSQPPQTPTHHQPVHAPATRPPANEGTPKPRIRLGELAHHDLTQRPAAAPQHQPQQGAARPASSKPLAHAVTTPAVEADDESLHLPEVVARRARELAELDERIQFEPTYRGARMIAHLLTWLGCIVVAGGLTFAVLGLSGIPSGLSVAIIGLPGGFVVGALGVIGGLAMALGGQVGLATFDQAQSLREIGIFMRTRADL